MTPASTIWSGPSGLVPPGRKPLVGDVAEFDEPRGLGIIEYGTGHRISCHCTAITDGSRRIDVGTVVSFEVAAGRLGRLEARSVRPLPGVVPPGSTLAHEESGFDVPFELPGREALRRELERHARSAATDPPSRAGPSPAPADPGPAPPVPPAPAISLAAEDAVSPPAPGTGMPPAARPDPAASEAASRWPLGANLTIEPRDPGGVGAESGPVAPQSAAPQSAAAPASGSWSVSAGEPDPLSPDSGPVDPEGSDGAGEGPEDSEGGRGDSTPPFGTPSGAPFWAVAPVPTAAPPPPPPPPPADEGSAGSSGGDEDPPRPVPEDSPASTPVGSPHPNFWSPIARPSSGPPPTWRTPVTPRNPPPTEGD